MANTRKNIALSHKLLSSRTARKELTSRARVRGTARKVRMAKMVRARRAWRGGPAIGGETSGWGRVKEGSRGNVL